MAERKAVNKYYPPDWDPSKGSINNYVGQHPLRDRAKKLHQGILVIRFEMPYNIWCGGCNAHIGMGVRYNAEKTKTGNYYSTPIYKFRMKCHLCDNYFEIQTDPKNHDYVILEGARRKEQRWDPKENEQIVPEDKATQKKLATDAMFKLEHGTDDRQKGKKAVSSLSQLESSKEGMKDDYILNKMARNKFREEKKALKKIQEDDEALLQKSSLDIQLIEEREADVKLAGLIRLRAVETYDEKQVQKRKEIESRPIFQSKKRSRTDESDSPEAKKFKIITDNIRKAKASSTSSPFDRMKSGMLGVCLTKDQLGIRKKTSKETNSPNKQSRVTDSTESNLPEHSEGGKCDGDNTCEKDSTQSRIELGHHDNPEDREKHDKGGEIVSDADGDINNCIVTPNNKLSNHNSKTDKTCAREISEENFSSKAKLTDAGEENVEIKNMNERTVLSNNQSSETLETDDNQQSEKLLTAISDKLSSSTESNSKPKLSLVAAYSDSEDTDTSTG